ncbi:coiled-coil domain-containing protein 142-like [Pollicipes pollicipes]|uniref:coiled-coil domain-containing protein 142-like n=1 Tax=Pollicipes pollicipes TaxID=41117 RepID=UPI0018857D15|nr:coiled-coil domain-containing protein 142-like [Pollicipes pollicipes]
MAQALDLDENAVHSLLLAVPIGAVGGLAAQPALAVCGAPAALGWLREVLDLLSEEMCELGLPAAGLASRLRLYIAPAYACFLLAPALHQGQSTRHVPVPLEGGQQCTKCGKLYYNAVAFLVGQLNQVLADQAAALATDEEGPDLLPLLQLQLVLQRQLRLCLHQLHLWLASRSQLLLASWQTSAYFLLTMADLPRCLRLLDSLQSAPPLDLVRSPMPELQEAVRERADSDRRLDHLCQLLQGCQTASLSSVSEACRSTALASLDRLMPGKLYWRRPAMAASQPSDYVRQYIDDVLEEVLRAVCQLGGSLQLTVGGLVVKVACHSWMEYIIQHNIKFSVAGARQLGA